MFEPFQEFIEKTAGQYGISREFRAIKVCTEFDKLFPLHFNVSLNPQKHISAGHFKNGTLYVKTTSPTWAQELIIRKQKLIHELNKNLKFPLVKDIKTIAK